LGESAGPGLDAAPTSRATIVRLMNAIQKAAKAARRDRIGLAIAGGVFVLLRLSSDYIPSPTRFKERTFIIVLALAAGAAGGFAPGVIAEEGRRPSVAVRATGATGLAMFIIILFYRFLA